MVGFFSELRLERDSVPYLEGALGVSSHARLWSTVPGASCRRAWLVSANTLYTQHLSVRVPQSLAHDTTQEGPAWIRRT